MKNYFGSRLGGTILAWEMLMDIAIPESVRRLCANKSVSYLEIAVGCVICGILCGLTLSLLSGLLNLSWLNPYVAGGLFAVLAAAFCEYKDSGRGLKLLVSAISRRCSGDGWVDSVLEASSADHALEKTTGGLAALLILLLELCCFGLLAYYGASLWCVVVFAGAFTIQMLFATLPRGMGYEPFVKVSSERRLKIWILPVLAAVFSFFFFPAATLVAAALIGVLGQMIHKDFLITDTPVTADIITLSGKITEIILLLCGVVFIL